MGVPETSEARPARKTAANLVDSARARIRRLEPEEALAAQSRGALLVDTRCRDARTADGTIPGAAAIPLSVLLWRFDPTDADRDASLADPDREVVLVCAHGYSSSIAAAQLLELGYESVGDVIGGFEAWRAAGLPIDAPHPLS